MAHHRLGALVTLIACTAFIGGCTNYQVPGGAADFRALGITRAEQDALTDDEIATRMDRKPAASFPAVVGVARVQDKGYRSYSWGGYRSGEVAIAGVRDIESQTDLERFARMPMIRSVVPLNRLVMGEVEDEIDLREAASRVQADMLFLYTFDTKFGVDTTVPALGVITLGLFPNDEARVTATASGVLIDTRTGFVYALAEATADTSQIANAWTNKEAVEQSRLRAQKDAFSAMLDQMAAAWEGVAQTHAPAPARNPG